MNKPYCCLILFLSMVYIVPSLASAEDSVRGALVAKARCATCHHLNRRTPLIGPSLQGIFGREPTITGVPFTRWGAKELDAWITNPRAIKPNTKMYIPPIAPRDRADVIAYLKESITAK